MLLGARYAFGRGPPMNAGGNESNGPALRRLEIRFIDVDRRINGSFLNS
jgi:hypothetical protein